MYQDFYQKILLELAKKHVFVQVGFTWMRIHLESYMAKVNNAFLPFQSIFLSPTSLK